jgi:hypothetical protein
MFMLRSGLILTLTLFGVDLLAQVKEMNNTEMTEAYIHNGAIVIKQRVNANSQEKKKTNVNITVGPGKPAISEASPALKQDSANTQRNQTFNREFSNNTPQQQLNQFEQAPAS